jgi:DNA-binding NarL/FixJ family response regulator
MAQLDTSPCDIVVLELNLGDLTATEFLMAARQGHPNSTFLLLDEASKAGQIVKALQAGLDGYLATPPDEDRLFYEVERHLARGSGAPSPGASAASGFEELSTQTAMQSMAEAAALQAAVADRESQVIELSDQLKQGLVELPSTGLPPGLARAAGCTGNTIKGADQERAASRHDHTQGEAARIQ